MSKRFPPVTDGILNSREYFVGAVSSNRSDWETAEFNSQQEAEDYVKQAPINLRYRRVYSVYVVEKQYTSKVFEEIIPIKDN